MGWKLAGTALTTPAAAAGYRQQSTLSLLLLLLCMSGLPQSLLLQAMEQTAYLQSVALLQPLACRRQVLLQQ
jgi:hypothetical protein